MLRLAVFCQRAAAGACPARGRGCCSGCIWLAGLPLRPGPPWPSSRSMPLTPGRPSSLLASIEIQHPPLPSPRPCPCPCERTAVKQEVDRNEDMLRSCLRAVDSLARLPAAQQVRRAARDSMCCTVFDCAGCAAMGCRGLACPRHAGAFASRAGMRRGGPAPCFWQLGPSSCQRAAATPACLCCHGRRGKSPFVPLPAAAPQVPAFKTFMDTLVLGPALKARPRLLASVGA